MKKLYFLIICSLFFLYPVYSFGQSPINDITTQIISGEHIQSFDNRININKDGTIDVVEKIVYDFDTLERHGIYRDIPYVKKNKDGQKYKMDFKVRSVLDETGKNYNYSESYSNDTLHLKIGDADRTITGVHTYIISYKVRGALTYFSDHDELYWNSTGNGWTIPIAKASATILLPEGIAYDDIKTACFTGSAGSTETDCTHDTTTTTSSFAANQVLYLNQGMTVVVGFPKNIVALLEPQLVVEFWDTFLGKLTFIGITLGLIFWYILLPLWIPIKWFLYGRDPQGNGPGAVRAWYDPPKRKDGTPLTPAETGVLIDESADLQDVQAIVVDLARRGYLKIVEKKKDDFYLVRTEKTTAGMVEFERTLYNGIFGGKNEVRIKDKKMATLVETVKTDLYEVMVANGFFPEDPSKVRLRYGFLSGFALFTGNFLLAFTAFVFGRAMSKRTAYGVEQMNVAKSLRNFLSSQERQLEFQAKNQMFFEKLLPFAVAFGVEKIWADRFKDLNLQEPDWYQGYYDGRFSTYGFTRSMHSSFSQMKTAATPVTSSTGHSSGFSGGSSGGGGGGGGGGSW